MRSPYPTESSLAPSAKARSPTQSSSATSRAYSKRIRVGPAINESTAPPRRSQSSAGGTPERACCTASGLTGCAGLTGCPGLTGCAGPADASVLSSMPTESPHALTGIRLVTATRRRHPARRPLAWRLWPSRRGQDGDLSSEQEGATVPIWLQAGAWGLIAGGALVVGALVAWFVRVPQQVVAAVMAFGAGVLISALAFDLVAEAERTGGLIPTIIGFLLGAVVYVAATSALTVRGARHRKRSQRGEQPSERQQSGSGAAIAIGALLDGIPES